MRSAALLRRDLFDHLPRGLRWLQRELAVAAVFGVLAVRFVPPGPGSSAPSWGSLLGFAR